MNIRRVKKKAFIRRGSFADYLSVTQLVGNVLPRKNGWPLKNGFTNKMLPLTVVSASFTGSKSQLTNGIADSFAVGSPIVFCTRRCFYVGTYIFYALNVKIHLF